MQQFEYQGFSRHPDKTMTGKPEKGFDWLGIWFSPQGDTISPRAMQQYQALLQQTR